MHVGILPACMCKAHGSQEGVIAPGTGVMSCHGMLKSSLGPLEELLMFCTTVPTPVPGSCFKGMSYLVSLTAQKGSVFSI